MDGVSGELFDALDLGHVHDAQAAGGHDDSVILSLLLLASFCVLGRYDPHAIFFVSSDAGHGRRKLDVLDKLEFVCICLEVVGDLLCGGE